MNLAPLTPAVVLLGIHLVLVFLGSKKHWVIDDNLIYRYPCGIAYFILVSYFAAACFLAFFPGAQTIDPRTKTIGVLAVAGLGTLGFIYTYWYRAILGRSAIHTGVIFLKEAAYAEIVRAKYVQGQNSGQIILYTRSGKRIHVWETIGDFGSFANELNARLPSGVSIPRDGRMALYLKDPNRDLPARVVEAAAHLRAQLESERHHQHSQS